MVCNPVLPGGIAGLSIIGDAKALRGDDLIRALAKAAGPEDEIVAFLTGKLRHQLEGFELPLSVPPLNLEIITGTRTLRPELSDNSLLYVESS